MSLNWIEHLDSTTFGAIPGLLSLNLSSNRISTLPDSAFANLPSLRELDLSYNSLRANFKVSGSRNGVPLVQTPITKFPPPEDSRLMWIIPVRMLGRKEKVGRSAIKNSNKSWNLPHKLLLHQQNFSRTPYFVDLGK